MNKMKTAWLIAVCALGSNMPAAHADFGSLVKGLLNNNTNINGGQPGYPDYSGQAYLPSQQYSNAPFFPGQQQQFYPGYPGAGSYNGFPGEVPATGAQAVAIDSNFTAAFANINQQIANMRATGQINPAQEPALRAQVNNLMNMRNAYASNGYTPSEVQQINSALQNFQSQLVSGAAGGAGFLPYGGGGVNPYYNGNNNGFNGGAIENFQNTVRSRIDQAKARGIINPSEAANLRFEYDRTVKQMNKSSNSYANQAAFAQLQALNSRIDELMASRGAQ